ncbi:gamma-glutamylcyclotransferase [Vibrio alfacsensis]|uniref:Gamma-glutamylcyclotransferase family protein n=1 Tax=Vibrio alfacsensis TaxID=1074311 RepID=A0ABM6YW84_9VIBR|nr:gamma-glutamylcyclotransferase [Vibrio alfacsensis]AXY02026.1 gamma-glutamylcyclotransferase [Vibrio alfacsensis]
MQHLVFVYGTLRSGESNHHYLSTAQFLGHHQTEPQFALYDLGPYPALSVGQKSIQGEVYLINEETLIELDKLEDVPVEYHRETIVTPFGQAWIYLYQDAEQLSDEIASGDWCQRV